MTNIELIILGSNMKYLDLNKIKKVKSKLFKIIETKVLSDLPEPEHNTGYLNQEYLDNQLRTIVGPDNDNIRICFINCLLENHFYVRRIFKKTAVISVFAPKQFLDNYSISTENFIIKNIYEMVSLYIESNGNLTADEIYAIPHIDTRGCLYDMNGDISNVVHNTEQPIICSSCKARLSRKSLPKDFLRQLEKEILKINKTLILKFELLIIEVSFVFIIANYFARNNYKYYFQYSY